MFVAQNSQRFAILETQIYRVFWNANNDNAKLNTTIVKTTSRLEEKRRSAVSRKRHNSRWVGDFTRKWSFKKVMVRFTVKTVEVPVVVARVEGLQEESLTVRVLVMLSGDSAMREESLTVRVLVMLSGDSAISYRGIAYRRIAT